MNGKKSPLSEAASLTELLDFCTAETPPDLSVDELIRLNESAQRHRLRELFQFAAVKKFGITLDEVVSSEKKISSSVRFLKLLSMRGKVNSLLMKKGLRFCFIKGGDLAFRAYPEP